MIERRIMENIDKLKEYYKQNCSPLIFVNETTLPNNKSAKVFADLFINFPRD